MRVALFNAKYSPNLGDGLLSECLEFELKRAIPGLTVVALDLTGRRDYASGSTGRRTALALLQRLPQNLRHWIARTVLGRTLRRIMPHWRAELETADAVILGGGNLFADADLNFPLKVAAAFGEVAIARLPTAVHAVGVSDNWSRGGERLFRSALQGVSLVHASVRDERSRSIWVRRLGAAGVAPPTVVRDPGLLAAECYPARERGGLPSTRVGIGLTHPVALRYHADDEITEPAALTWWLAALVRAFTYKGWSVFLFTNGSPEDEAYLVEATPRLLAGADPAGSVTRVPRFTRPAELAGFISTLDLLAAHRLHACIAAYSYGVAHIGFTWDNKLRSFFESVDRGRFVCSAVTTPVEGVITLAEEAMRLGIRQDERMSVLVGARDDIGALARSLAAAAPPAAPAWAAPA